jgi:hypothetical protein
MKKFILIIFTLVLFFSCKDSPPSGVIKQDKMKNVLWDVLRADALSNEIVKRDSGKSIAGESAMLTKKVFLIHHITEDEFNKSYSYYSAHPDIMKAMLDSINAQQVRKSIPIAPTLPKGKLPDSIKKS